MPTLTDASSSVDVRFGLTGTSTIIDLSGEGPGRPLTGTIAGANVGGAAVHAGEPVLTSGLANAAYPGGIPVGRVAAVSSANGGLAEQVSVTPFTVPSQLQYVAVVLWTPDA